MARHSGMQDREPCPWRIVDDVGGAFTMGAVGGTVWHTIKGLRMSPKGGKIAGAVSAVTARAPVLGGQFAVWGGLFACCDCTLTAIRQKEDPWNAIMSGAATGGILAARAGPQAMFTSAVFGGVILALIEGASIMLGRAFAPPVPTAEDYAQGMAQDVTAPPTAGGLYPTGGFSPSPASPPPSDASAPHPSETVFSSDGDGTTFQTEGSSGDASSADSSKSWFSFGSSS
mmetsp:Transcript_17858/g.42137  ORF Transcript_17858/g.42137 Transcript_17858/m.42137 type:complete len:229 (-) Transcript_17858:132-818(-)